MGEFDDLDEEKTLVEESRDTLKDLIPDAPPVAPLEVVFDREMHQAGVISADVPYRALEIWTQNRVYMVDSTMTCCEVRDRHTGVEDKKHSVLGARLVGGQRKYGKTLHVARPFPVPGTEAVFERDGKRTPAGVTSKVERVVLHIRVTSVVMEQQGAWDDVTSAFLHPSFGHRGSR
ncbi:hypothetical protein [Sandaracinus amylolyticus]|uniref:Uncharacterized protein n=1 Tax=Sandaracinus amylolyticus TaxID=927083 RepID=A0A0F6SH73_9BACT|nr:hypothetical protein [Sandaracinus amylolyticus]AKF09944.1 hypothetical protein DB32_007093 [Sandaracinus amylolyticus]